MGAARLKSPPERPQKPETTPKSALNRLQEAEIADLAALEADLSPIRAEILADDREIGVWVLMEARAAELSALPGLIDELGRCYEDAARLRHPAGRQVKRWDLNWDRLM